MSFNELMRDCFEDDAVTQLRMQLRDPRGFSRVCKREYCVHVCRANLVEPKKIFNYLEKAVYIPNERKPFIIQGTVGELWVVDPEKLVKTYEMPDGTPISPEDVGLGWTKIKTRPDSSHNWAMQISPAVYGDAATKIEIKTSWGDVLHPNAAGIPHGSGDYAVCSDNNGSPNLEDMWVVNGEVFLNTYQDAADKTNRFG